MKIEHDYHIKCPAELFSQDDPLNIGINSSAQCDPLAIKPDPDQHVLNVKKEESEDDCQETQSRPGLSARQRHRHTNNHAGERSDVEQSCGQQQPETGIRPGRRRSASAARLPQRTESGETALTRKSASGTLGRDRFFCNACDKSFPCRSWLEKHLRTHSKERPFRCQFCGQAFTQTSSLNKHVRCQHSGLSKPFRCGTCDKGFSTRCYLRVHEASHSGNMRVTCKICGRSFTHKKLLNIHLKSHSGRFRCEECDASFVCQSKLDLHVHRRHSAAVPAECDICGSAFASQASLNRHVGLKHAGPAKAFGCDACGRTFTTKRSLTVHIASHTGEYRVSCDVCSKSFSHPRLLNMHRKSHDRPVKPKQRQARLRVTRGPGDPLRPEPPPTRDPLGD